jgi:ATP-dependent protease ClpP protease subunit
MAKRLSHDDIDKFFEYGLDVPNRTIYLGCASYDDEGNDGNGVDFFMAERFIKALHVLDRQAPAGDKPITIIANNPGGSWYHGMAMYGAIKSCKNHVTIKMYGYAMSMGSIIPQAADERLIDKYCRFMIHYGYDGSSGHSKIFSRHGDEGKKVNYEMENIYLDRMLEKDAEEAENGNEGYLESVLADIMNRQVQLEFPKPAKIKYKFSQDEKRRREDVRKVLKELLNYDSFFTAEETVALGFADKVVGDEP